MMLDRPALPALPPRDFCLIRHGETTANRDALIAGRLDVALSDLGRSQAKRLAQMNWPQPITLFASPLSRAMETARLGFPEHSASVCAALRERDWGVFEGRPLAELPPRDATPEAGEAWHQMILRVHAAITQCCAASGPRLAVMVCHSGVIRATRLLAGQANVGTRAANARPIHFRYLNDQHEEHPHEL